MLITPASIMQSMPDSMMKRNIGSAKRKKTSSALLEAKN